MDNNNFQLEKRGTFVPQNDWGQSAIALQPGDSTGGEGINLRHYWHVALERRWLVLTVFLSIFILTLVYLFRAPLIYQSVARLQIDRESENVLNIREVFSMDGREQDYLQTQYKNLQSRTLIETLITKLGLSNDVRYSLSKDIYKSVANDITVAPIRLSRLVDIKVEHTDAKQAAKIANALADTFVQENLNLKMSKSMEAFNWLTNEANNLQDKVNKADRALQDYKEKTKRFHLMKTSTWFLKPSKQNQSDLDKARSAASDAQKLASEVERLVKDGASIESIGYVANDLLIKKYKEILGEKQTKLKNLLITKKEKWPEVLQAREDVDTYQTLLATEARKIFESIKNEAVIALAKVVSAEQTLQQQEAKQLELSKLKIDYDKLHRDAEHSKLLYNNVVARMKETEVTGRIKTNNMRVVDPAKVATVPISPRRC